MIKYLVSSKVASGDTVKTSLGTITLPAGSKELRGVWCSAGGGAGLTTLENVSGIFELESPDINVQPCQIPLEPEIIVGTGIGTPNIKVWPMNAVVRGTERMTGYVTMDIALAINPDCRFGLIVEVAN